MEQCCPYAPPGTDLPSLLRHLKGSHPEMTESIEEKTQVLAQHLRNRWQEVFRGPLKLDVVCHSETKLTALKEAMAVSDLVPLVFGLDVDDTARGVIRVSVEI